MADITKTFVQATDKLLTLFPHRRHGVSLANWNSLKREADEDAAPNLGSYTVTLDDTYRYWFVYEGSDAPDDWDQWVDILDIYDGAIRSEDLGTSALAAINKNRRA